MTRLLANPLSIYLAVAGSALLIGAVALLIARLRLATGGERAQGQVIGYERLRSRPDEPVQFMPLVRYSPPGSAPIEFQSQMGSDSKPFAIGEPVPVLYRKHQPRVAEIDFALRLWLAPAIIAGMGIVMLFASWKAGAPR